ncbi:MAG TPA: hypothetical protein VMD91_15175 [Candidatus Sulfotelmatobacter sp.]|nr:hypothetical protein [Candidatus Sulfotelmatobacter sp.]
MTTRHVRRTTRPPASKGRLSAIAAGLAVGLIAVLSEPARAEPPPITPTVAVPTTTTPQAVLGQFATAWATVTSYTATVSIFERAGTQTQNVVLEYTFHRPSNVSVHVDAGPNAGVTMVWDGGTTVVAHRGSGLAALFKKTFPLHDPLATTIRGSSVDQLSFGAILAHAQDETGRLTQAPQADIDGVGVAAVTLTSADPAADAGLTREIVELSSTTRLPVQVLGYDGTMLVRKIDFSNVVVER